MKRILIISTVILSLNCVCFASLSVLSYSLEDLGGSRWQCNYQLGNIALEEPIEEFTIWFDNTFYDDITIAPQDPQWDLTLLLDVPNLGDGFDALALDTGISRGQASPSFSVSFDWLGQEPPAPQFFEVVDTDTYQVLDSGISVEVPEPTSLAILSIAGLMLRRRLKTND